MTKFTTVFALALSLAVVGSTASANAKSVDAGHRPAARHAVLAKVRNVARPNEAGYGAGQARFLLLAAMLEGVRPGLGR